MKFKTEEVKPEDVLFDSKCHLFGWTVERVSDYLYVDIPGSWWHWDSQRVFSMRIHDNGASVVHVRQGKYLKEILEVVALAESIYKVEFTVDA